MRLTLGRLSLTRFPEVIGKCPGDIPQISATANSADQRLVFAGGETGWWGGWQRVIFAISRANPYITLPPRFARIINLDLCRTPVRINNEFYEMLEGGPGLRTPGDACQPDWCGNLEGFERGLFPSMVDLSGSNQFLRVYLTDPADAGKRVFVSDALDQNGHGIYSQDATQRANGFFLVLGEPFATTDFIVTKFGGIEKDITAGDVLLKQVDATTGQEVLLSRYGPDEQLPQYRRYFLSNVPQRCISSANPQVTSLCKLEHIAARNTTDFFVIGNEEAMIEEGQAIRYSSMDSGNAAAQEAKHHATAIRLLQDEQRHYQGSQKIAVGYAPFGRMRMGRKRVGSLI